MFMLIFLQNDQEHQYLYVNIFLSFYKYHFIATSYVFTLTLCIHYQIEQMIRYLTIIPPLSVSNFQYCYRKHLMHSYDFK